VGLGQRLDVIEKGAPIEAGGKVLGHRKKKPATPPAARLRQRALP